MPATIAIIGRPNVGKSTLFNRLLRKNLAITHDTPGVTRDRILGTATLSGVTVDFIDTGGMIIGEDNEPGDGLTGQGFEAQILQQAKDAMNEADALLMVVDGREGLTQLDQEAAMLIRSSGKPTLLLVNKVDGGELEDQALSEFYALGFEMMAVSASHGFNIHEFRDRVRELAEEFAPPEVEDDGIERGLRIALLGRPNAGKSSMINAITGTSRLIVSDVAGTTRDAVDVTFEKDGTRYTFVDTAGVRRRTNIKAALEHFSVVRSLKSARKADVTVMVVDAVDGLTHQDKRLLDYLIREKTPFILVVNKIDLIPKDADRMLREAFDRELRFADHVPVFYTSALKKVGIAKVLPATEQMVRECATRVGTGQLNRAMEEVLVKHQPPVVKRKRPKFFYMTQADSDVPTFVFFVNDHTIIKPTYVRYIENALRKMFDIHIAPLDVVLRSSHEKRKAEPKRGVKAYGGHGP
ncbi:MAG: ribosome biogenesis GTPase Der, partial [Proteobacteria bacterium]|nr:ribosome biogenesis GTPase Der [Pseudomonadota bacterium]